MEGALVTILSNIVDEISAKFFLTKRAFTYETCNVKGNKRLYKISRIYFRIAFFWSVITNYFSNEEAENS